MKKVFASFLSAANSFISSSKNLFSVYSVDVSSDRSKYGHNLHHLKEGDSCQLNSNKIFEKVNITKTAHCQTVWSQMLQEHPHPGVSTHKPKSLFYPKPLNES